MIRHRFIVVGAFQALNATEARHHLGLDDADCELVFLVPPQPRAAEEARTIIDDLGWSRVRVMGPPATSVVAWARRVRNARSLIDDSASLDHLVIGDYQTQIARHAAHGLRHGEVVVLDDGAATLRVNAYRRAVADGTRPPRLHPQVPRHRYEIQRVAARFLGLKLGDLERVTFFSLYDIRPAPHDTSIRNRFEWLRRRFPDPKVTDGALFLGSPFVEVGILPHETYVTMLRRLKERADGELWYRPHPREDAGHVNRLIDDVGLEVLELDTIVEYGLLDQGWLPARVTANHSTGLDSLRVILGDRVSVQSIPLPVSLVGRRWRDWIGRAYEEMDSRLGEPVERLELLEP